MEKNNKNNTPFAFSFGNPVRALFALAAQYADRTCMLEPRGNMVRRYPYRELAAMVETLAVAVSRTKTFDAKPIAIISRCSFRSVAAYFGALLGGGKIFLIPANASAEEQEQIIADNHIELLMVENPEAHQELIDRIAFLPDLRQIWALQDDTDASSLTQVSTLDWQQVLRLAEDAHPRVSCEQLLEALRDDALCSRFYSRNESGDLQYHDYSLAELADETQESIDLFRQRSPAFESVRSFLSIIPFNRVLGHIQGIYMPIFTGRILMTVDRDEAWKVASLPYSPDCVVANSAFLQKAADRVQAEVAEHGGIAQFTFQQNLSRLRRKLQEGSRFDGQEMINLIAGRTVHLVLRREIISSFGGDIRLCLSIDDQMDTAHALFYRSAGISLLSGDETALLVSAKKLSDENNSFSALRGAQLARSREVMKLKIIG